MKKIFKLFTFFIMAIFIGLSFSPNVSADTGPKPFIEIDIKGDTKGMYMTILSKDSNYGPWSYDHSYDDKVDEINEKFKEYSLNDEFYYWYQYDDISNGEYYWGYYPPQTFKIVIYDSINDRMITNNEIYSRYRFESRFVLTLTETSFTVVKNNDVSKNIAGFFLRLAICLSIELIIALVFGLRRQQLLIVLISNVITQLFLNIVLYFIIINQGFQVLLIVPVFFILEIIVLAVEYISYVLFVNKISNKYNLKNQNAFKLFAYTLLANLASLVLGAVILIFLHY